MKRKAAKPERRPALPLVQGDDVLRAEHASLTAEGYVLDQFLGIRLDRRRLKARVTITWRKKFITGKGSSRYAHEVTLDLRKFAR